MLSTSVGTFLPYLAILAGEKVFCPVKPVSSLARTRFGIPQPEELVCFFTQRITEASQP